MQRADACFEELRREASDTGRDKAERRRHLEGTAGLAGAVKEDIRAARLWGAAEAAREVTGVALLIPRAGAARAPPGCSAFPEGETTWEEAGRGTIHVARSSRRARLLRRRITPKPRSSNILAPRRTDGQPDEARRRGNGSSPAASRTARPPASSGYPSARQATTSPRF